MFGWLRNLSKRASAIESVQADAERPTSGPESVEVAPSTQPIQLPTQYVSDDDADAPERPVESPTSAPPELPALDAEAAAPDERGVAEAREREPHVKPVTAAETDEAAVARADADRSENAPSAATGANTAPTADADDTVKPGSASTATVGHAGAGAGAQAEPAANTEPTSDAGETVKPGSASTATVGHAAAENADGPADEATASEAEEPTGAIVAPSQRPAMPLSAHPNFAGLQLAEWEPAQPRLLQPEAALSDEAQHELLRLFDELFGPTGRYRLEWRTGRTRGDDAMFAEIMTADLVRRVQNTIADVEALERPTPLPAIEARRHPAPKTAKAPIGSLEPKRLPKAG